MGTCVQESSSAIKNEMLPFSGKLKELLIVVLRKINSITTMKVMFSFTQDLDLKGKKRWTGEMAQWMRCLQHKSEDLSEFPGPAKSGKGEPTPWG